MSGIVWTNIDASKLVVGDFVNYRHRHDAGPGTLCFVIHIDPLVIKSFSGAHIDILEVQYEEELFELTTLMKDVIKAWATATMKAMESVGPLTEDPRP